MNFQPVGREPSFVAVLDNFIRVHNDRDEEREDNVDEQADEGVEVYPTVHPNSEGLLNNNYFRKNIYIERLF